MKQLFRMLERLSLDAVLVAVVWGFALGGAWPETGILGMATWLTYVADRLWEVRPGKPVPATDRHQYYRDNFSLFRIMWVFVMLIAIGSALLILPLWKLVGGCGLVVFVVVYLWALGVVTNPSKRLLLKRLIVPIIFVGGVTWMAESWRALDCGAGTILLLSAAMANLFLISYWENHDKVMPEWVPGLTEKSLLALLICTAVIMPMHWQSGLAGLLCCAGYGYLFWMIRNRKADFVRAWVDGILAVAGMVLFLNPW